MKGRRWVKVSSYFICELFQRGCAACEPVDPMPLDAELVEIDSHWAGTGIDSVRLTFIDSHWAGTGIDSVRLTFESAEWTGSREWQPGFRKFAVPTKDPLT